MKNSFEIKNMGRLMIREGKLRLKSTIIWAIAMAVIMVFYMSVFSSIKEMMQEKFDNLPSELMAIVGISGSMDLANYSIYFAMIFKLVLTILSGYAIFSAVSCLHDEEETGTIEFLNSQSVSRVEIVVAKFLILCINMIIIMIAMLIATLIIGVSLGEPTFDAMIIFKIYLLSMVTPLVFVALGMLIATLLKKNVKASGVGLGVFFGLYLFGYLSNIGVKSLEFFKWLSPIDYIDQSALVDYYKGVADMASGIAGFVISIALIIVAIVIGTMLYTKKDL